MLCSVGCSAGKKFPATDDSEWQCHFVLALIHFEQRMANNAINNEIQKGFSEQRMLPTTVVL